MAWRMADARGRGRVLLRLFCVSYRSACARNHVCVRACTVISFQISMQSPRSTHEPHNDHFRKLLASAHSCKLVHTQPAKLSKNCCRSQVIEMSSITCHLKIDHEAPRWDSRIRRGIKRQICLHKDRIHLVAHIQPFGIEGDVRAIQPIQPINLKLPQQVARCDGGSGAYQVHGAIELYETDVARVSTKFEPGETMTQTCRLLGTNRIGGARLAMARTSTRGPRQRRSAYPKRPDSR